MNTYQPKINLEAVRMGYLGVDPKAVGLAGGYQTRMTQPNTDTTNNNKESQGESPKRRPNPYIK